MNVKEIIEFPIGSRVFVVSHRGSFGGNIPENTIAAFRNAVNNGADIIETDVTRLSDEALILFHDVNVGRMTSREGASENYSFDQLQK